MNRSCYGNAQKGIPMFLDHRIIKYLLRGRMQFEAVMPCCTSLWSQLSSLLHSLC